MTSPIRYEATYPEDTLGKRIILEQVDDVVGRFKDRKIQIRGQTINYINVGNGDHAILCFPGALGSIWSDFRPQIEGLDRNKFNIVVWDPPGYGHSRQPNRRFDKKFYETDADMAYVFMQGIGIKRYSLLGWSDGGISSMILSAKYPQCVNKLVVWGANAYVIPSEIEVYEKLRDTNKWSDKMKTPLVKLYGERGLEEMWGGWCDALREISNNGGNICKHFLPKIACPTFVLHGAKDPMVAPEHPDHIVSNIKGSTLYTFPEGKHNIHLRYADDFNALVTKFLVQ